MRCSAVARIRLGCFDNMSACVSMIRWCGGAGVAAHSSASAVRIGTCDSGAIFVFVFETAELCRWWSRVPRVLLGSGVVLTNDWGRRASDCGTCVHQPDVGCSCRCVMQQYCKQSCRHFVNYLSSLDKSGPWAKSVCVGPFLFRLLRRASSSLRAR